MDDIFSLLHPSISTLSRLKEIEIEKPISPMYQPEVIQVEPVKPGKDAAPNSVPTAFRYILVFPGSRYLRIQVKVQESAPSITQEELEASDLPIKVSVEGFYLGSFSVDGGGRKAYAKADKITPIRVVGQNTSRKEGV